MTAALLMVLAAPAGSVYTKGSVQFSSVKGSDLIQIEPHGNMRLGASTTVDPRAAALERARMATATRGALKKASHAGKKVAAAQQLAQEKPLPLVRGIDHRRSVHSFLNDATKGTFAPTTTVQGPDSTTKATLEGELEHLGVDISNFTANYTHTWGLQKNNVLGLPGWAAVLIAGVSAALIMIIFTTVGARLAHPLPFFASGEQLMKDRIEQAREKVRALEAAVEAKKAQEQYEKEEEERKAREAIEGPAPSGPSHDELVGEMLYRTQEVQKQAVGAVNDSIKQAAPLLARAAHVQHVFKQSVTGVQDRVGEMALKEASNLYSKMKEAVGSDENPTLAGLALDSSLGSANDGLPDWFKFGEDDGGETDPPPFALLLSGMFAPAQLKWSRSQCNTQIIWNSMMLAISTACLTIDNRHGCPDKMVWAWIFGMLAINALDVICCSYIAANCATAIGSLQDDEDATARIRKTGNVIWDSYIMLQANSGHFFKAYFAYQNVQDSWVFSIQKILTFVATLWGAFGMWISIEDIVEDSLTCDARVVLWFMHTYSFFFLLFITWNIVGLVLWILKKMSGCNCVSAPLLAMAKDSDQEVPFKMPIFQTLTRAFVLRDNNQMLILRAGQLEKEVTDLEKTIEDTKSKLENRKYYLEELEAKRLNAAKREQKLVDTYKEKVIASGGTLPGDVVTGSGSASSSAAEVGGASSLDRRQSGSAAAEDVPAGGWAASFAQSQAAAMSAMDAASSSATSAAATVQAQAANAPTFTGMPSLGQQRGPFAPGADAGASSTDAPAGTGTPPGDESY